MIKMIGIVISMTIITVIPECQLRPEMQANPNIHFRFQLEVDQHRTVAALEMSVLLEEQIGKGFFIDYLTLKG